jgi:hypothetical protein
VDQRLNKTFMAGDWATRPPGMKPGPWVTEGRQEFSEYVTSGGREASRKRHGPAAADFLGGLPRHAKGQVGKRLYCRIDIGLPSGSTFMQLLFAKRQLQQQPIPAVSVRVPSRLLPLQSYNRGLPGNDQSLCPTGLTGEGALFATVKNDRIRLSRGAKLLADEF